MAQNDNEQAKQSLVIAEEQHKTLNTKLEVCGVSVLCLGAFVDCLNAGETLQHHIAIQCLMYVWGHREKTIDATRGAPLSPPY